MIKHTHTHTHTKKKKRRFLSKYTELIYDVYLKINEIGEKELINPYMFSWLVYFITTTQTPRRRLTVEAVVLSENIEILKLIEKHTQTVSYSLSSVIRIRHPSVCFYYKYEVCPKSSRTAFKICMCMKFEKLSVSCLMSGYITSKELGNNRHSNVR